MEKRRTQKRDTSWGSTRTGDGAGKKSRSLATASRSGGDGPVASEPPGEKTEVANDATVRTVQPLSKRTDGPRGIMKESVASDGRSRVTFRLPAQAAPEAGRITIVGDFNDWDREATPLQRTEDGDYTVTLLLASGKEYRFRYLIDGERWENDWSADKYVKSPYGTEDSVVSV